MFPHCETERPAAERIVKIKKPAVSDETTGL